MAVTPDGMAKFKAEIVSIKGECGAGHRAGDVLSLSCWDAGGLCGYFFHDVFPYLTTLQLGGAIPWAPDGVLSLECPDRHNLVTLKLSKE